MKKTLWLSLKLRLSYHKLFFLSFFFLICAARQPDLLLKISIQDNHLRLGEPCGSEILILNTYTYQELYMLNTNTPRGGQGCHKDHTSRYKIDPAKKSRLE